MRLLTALCLTAAVVAFAVPAFAETQNVKISGETSVAHVLQHNIDLADAGTGSQENDSEQFFIQGVALNVEADLTDNVSTYVRVINERDWNAENEAADGFNIELAQASVTLKEMLYAPLTLKIGRQDIWLGKGFVIGNAGPTVWDTNGNLPTTIAEASYLSAFDAIRATLDYDPWTIDLIYAKIDESTANLNDDTDLYIANVGYQFTKYDAEAEAYYIAESDKIGSAGTVAANTSEDSNETHTIGLRGSFVPFDNMNVWAEGALQVGKYACDAVANQDITSDREASALDIGGNYTFVDVRWIPTIGAEYVFWSGEDLQSNGTVGGDWDGWNALYPGKFDTYIAAFREITKPTDFEGYGAAGDTTANNNGGTNEQQFAVFGSVNPMADVVVDARWTYLWFDEPPRTSALPDRDEEIGHELDGVVTYDYTEDVEFKLIGAIFWPGDYYKSDSSSDNEATAAQVISTVKVEF